MGGAVFKTVVAWLNPGPVGSIPTRPRHLARRRAPALRSRVSPLRRSAVLPLILPPLIGCARGARPAVAPPPAPRVERTTEIIGEGAVRTAATVAPDPTDASDAVLATVRGEATYYADFFDGRVTASGIVFDNEELFAAHRDYPFGTLLRVTNPANGRAVEVRVVDRLPQATAEAGRRTVVDVSRRVAELLDFLEEGRIPVVVEVLEWGGGA